MFYLDLFRVLQQEEVRYLVVGGLEVNLYGVERATMDVDLMRAMDDENVARFASDPAAPTLDDLIRMKAATGRRRDLSDIEALEKARRIADDGKD